MENILRSIVFLFISHGPFCSSQKSLSLTLKNNFEIGTWLLSSSKTWLSVTVLTSWALKVKCR
jgi:hypothetical protein